MLSAQLLYWITPALLVSSAGVFLLWHAWSENHRLAFRLGTSLSVLSFYLWSKGIGAEFGSVFAFVAIALTAWICCVWQLEPGGTYTRFTLPVGKPRKKVSTGNPAWWQQLLVQCLLVGPSALLSSVWFGRLLPLSSGNQMAFAALFFPVLWALFALWFSRYQQQWRVNSLKFAGLALLGVGLVLV